jgi:hypothetical protein
MDTWSLIGKSVSWLAVIVFGVLPMAAGFFFAIFGTREDAERKRQIDATRRTETIDGKDYSVYTLPRSVVREKKTGRVGIALQRGYYPWWIRVQFIRKTDGEPERVEWREASKFEMVGTADVDYLSHRSSIFGGKELVRCNINSEIGARSKHQGAGTTPPSPRFVK